MRVITLTGYFKNLAGMRILHQVESRMNSISGQYQIDLKISCGIVGCCNQRWRSRSRSRGLVTYGARAVFERGLRLELTAP